MVRNEFAHQHNLYGEEITTLLATVSGTLHLDTRLYLVELFNRDNQRKVVIAFCLESINRILLRVTYG